MRVLTVRQPWAWAIIHGGKDVENRVRSIAGDYRGPVAIHAALPQFEDWGQYWEVVRAVETESLGWPASDSEVWSAERLDENDPRFIYGSIIGVVDLTDSHQWAWYYASIGAGVSMITDRPCCGKWAERDAHHLRLSKPRPLTRPIPFKGALGLRRLDADTIDLIHKELT